MYQKTILKNGLRLLTIPLKTTKVVTVLIMVKVGSRYEDDKIAGISHFAEHMFYKGTKKRPTALAISSEIDSVGGEMNAFTSKEFTGFYLKLPSKHLELAVDILADILQNSLFNPEEIAKEKGVIIQELNMYEDVPMRYVGELFENQLYSGHPLGRLIIGSKESIKSINHQDFKEYINHFYRAENMVVCVAGDISDRIEKIQNLINAKFEMPSAEAIRTFEKIEEAQKEPQILEHPKKTEQTHFCLGFRGFHVDHPDKYILKVLGVLLGGSMSSRLFEEIREKRGLAYYVRASAPCYKDVGYLVIQAGVEHSKLKKTIQVILKELRKVKNQKVGALELKKAKEYFKGRIILDIEDSYNYASLMAGQELLSEKVRRSEEIFAEIDKVTPAEIQKVAEEVFVPEKLNLAVITPKKVELDFEL